MSLMPPPPLNIIVTANTSWNILHFRLALVQDLLAAGHRVTVLAPEDAASDRLRALGCGHVALQISGKGLDPREGLALYRQFLRGFQRLRPDVVLSYTIKNNIFGAFAARRAGVIFLPNVTGLGTAFLSGRALQLLAEWLYRRAFARLPLVFFQNPEDQQEFLRRGLIKTPQGRVLPGSGIDLAVFQPAVPRARPSPMVFLMIARLLRDKGVREYVEAARQVRRQLPAVQFRLIGALGSDNRSAITPSELQAWQAEGVIDYQGTFADIRPSIADCDCVVLPSYREGAPRVLIEAAAMARPVIASDVPGCRSVVQEGVTGLLCRARDADSLAQACLRLCALPEPDKTAMREAARRRMEQVYDQAHVLAAYRTALAELTGGAAL